MRFIIENPHSVLYNPLLPQLHAIVGGSCVGRLNWWVRQLNVNPFMVLVELHIMLHNIHTNFSVVPPLCV